MAKTLEHRGYVHLKNRAVLIYLKALECWTVDHINKAGKINKKIRPLYGFHTERTKAITKMRSQLDSPKMPQQGWVKLKVKEKGLNNWDELVLLFWKEANGN